MSDTLDIREAIAVGLRNHLAGRLRGFHVEVNNTIVNRGISKWGLRIAYRKNDLIGIALLPEKVVVGWWSDATGMQKNDMTLLEYEQPDLIIQIEAEIHTRLKRYFGHIPGTKQRRRRLVRVKQR